MEKQYRRVADIDEKIKNLSLPYFQWKVLFLVLEETNIEELVNTLNSDEKSVKEALDSLEQNGVLEITGDSDVSSTEKLDEVEEQTSKESEAIADDLEETEVELEETKEDEEVSAEIVSESEEKVEETDHSEIETPVAELLEESEEVEKEEVEPVSEETSEQDSIEGLESESEEAVDQDSSDTAEELMEDTIEKVFEGAEEESETIDIDTDDQEKEDDAESDFNFETAEEPEVAEESEDDSTDISSFIDEIGETDEESEMPAEIDAEQKIEEESVDVTPEKKEMPKEGFKTIMVIDDSIVIRKMVEIALEDGDYNIVTSNSGKEGLKLLDEENPDLVIVDMTLPDMNGIDLLKTVKASKGIPVIMLSGKDAPQLIENAKNAGADDFLPKPFRDDDLIEKVKSLVK